jgi:phosphoribosylanthranilate isomerase
MKTEKDIECANHAKIDYAGFIFAPSRNQITPDIARNLRKRLDKSIKAVGVFVSEPVEMILELVTDGVIDLVQFHGEVEYAMPCETIRAMKLSSKDDIFETSCTYALFDSHKKGMNSGGVFDWTFVKDYKEKPFFLAGGINPENVDKAVLLHPYCIDISSGAETNGEKDLTKILAVKKIVEATSEKPHSSKV